MGAPLFVLCSHRVVAFSNFSSSRFPSLFLRPRTFRFRFFVGLAAVLESLLVVRELGVQVTTKYVDGREKSTVRQTSDPPMN